MFEASLDQRLTKEMRSFEAGIAAHVKLVELKLPIYRRLWELSSVFQSAHTDASYNEADLQRVEVELRDWYYKGGNGAMLSFPAQSRLQAGLRLLRARASDPRVIREVFSMLRTQLKLDLGVYSATEATSRLHIEKVLNLARGQVESRSLERDADIGTGSSRYAEHPEDEADE